MMPPLISISIKITTSSVTLETFVSKIFGPRLVGGGSKRLEISSQMEVASQQF